MADHQIPLLVTFASYGLIVILIAYVATRTTKNLSDYVLGGRRLSGAITALGAGASDMSSWLLMALPGLVYAKGLSMIWMPVALLIGAFFNWQFVAKRLRIYTEVANDSLTIPAFFANRFHDKSNMLRGVTAVATIIFFTYYTVAGFISGAMLLENIFNFDYLNALLISASIIVAYTAIGGFLAVSWVDFFQGILMLTSLVIVPVITCVNIGGFSQTLSELQNLSISHLNLFENVKLLGLISLFAWGLGYFGQPHINVRFMAIRSVSEVSKARFICMNWMSLSLCGAIATGLTGFVYYQYSPLQEQDTVFISLAQTLFNPWLAGVLLSAVLSAIMSTVSAQILITTSIIVDDFYYGFLGKTKTNSGSVWLGRAVLFTTAVIPIILASDRETTIIQNVGFAWSGLGAAFGPVTLFSLFWEKTTKQGAFIGMLSGMLMVIAFRVLSKYYGGVFVHPDILPGFELLPAFIVSSFSIVVVSLLTPKPSIPVLADFAKTKRYIDQHDNGIVHDPLKAINKVLG